MQNITERPIRCEKNDLSTGLHHKECEKYEKSIQQMLVRNQPDVAATLQMPSLRRLSMRSKVLGKELN